MSKILDNTTGAPIVISDTGVTVDNVTDYTIPSQDYLLWAASSDIITEIGAGNIVVNDGSNDLSISDGTDLIKGLFPSLIGIEGGTTQTQIGNIGDALKVSSSTIVAGEFATFKSSTEVVLSSDVTWDTLHSVSSSGVFVGATFVVDNTTIECQVVIDGSVVFDFTGDFLSEVVNKDSDYKASGLFGVTGDGKRLYFSPTTPINYHTSLEFRARKSGKKIKYQLYTYSEM